MSALSFPSACRFTIQARIPRENPRGRRPCACCVHNVAAQHVARKPSAFSSCCWKFRIKMSSDDGIIVLPVSRNSCTVSVFPLYRRDATRAFVCNVFGINETLYEIRKIFRETRILIQNDTASAFKFELLNCWNFEFELSIFEYLRYSEILPYVGNCFIYPIKNLLSI